MTAARATESYWEEEGRKLGALLGNFSSLVVIGGDPTRAAEVAIGLGRVQAERRRVAIGDLLGDAPPLVALVEGDDPHGIVDSFLYGVSLNRIARQVAGTEQLYVLPTGSESPEYETILGNPRFARLAAGFREMGALLILVAPPDAPRIEELVEFTDGAVVVGGTGPASLPLSRVVAHVREQTVRPGGARPVAAPALGESVSASEAATAPPPASSRWRWAAISAAVVLLLLLGALSYWLMTRPLAGGTDPRRPPAARAGQPPAIIQPVPVDSTAIPVPVVLNPQDSAASSAFGVELMSTNTQPGAILKLRAEAATLPAGTFAPFLEQGARWFKVLGGAYATRAGADSLLVSLRARKVLESTSGVVVRVPYAFLVDTAVPPATVSDLVASLSQRGLPVYALRQENGSLSLFAGAFESPEQSVLLIESLRAAQIEPRLVYRKGRVF